MAKSYVKFEVSNEVVAKTYEALQLAKQSGSVKKGANEVTKSVERGLATFVVIATDVEPEEALLAFAVSLFLLNVLIFGVAATVVEAAATVVGAVAAVTIGVVVVGALYDVAT